MTGTEPLPGPAHGPGPARLALLGMLPLLASGAFASLVALVSAWRGPGSEPAVQASGGLSVLAVLAVLGGLRFRRRTSLRASEVTAVLVASAAVILAGYYFYWVSSLVGFRADILLWSESDFVNDILKLRAGYPLFSEPANLESFHYPPGAQLVTYAVARVAGLATSIPMYRAVQVGFAVLAALVAVASVPRLLRLAGVPDGRAGLARWIWVPVLFLAATNERSNGFVHFLHNDALALLISAVAYWLLLAYAGSRRPGLLILMALVPVAGFYVKQSLAIWAVLYTGYLVLFDRPRSLPRAAMFAVGAFGLVGLGIGLGRLLWGAHWDYWIFTVLSNHPVNPLRSLDHVFRAWAYAAAVLAGGTLILLRTPDPRVLGAWLVAVTLLVTEFYTSGVAWMLNHAGPGCLLAALWLVAGMTAAWPALAGALDRLDGARGRVVSVAVAGALALMASGLSMIRIPRPGLAPDARRYVAEIEAEFAAGRVDRTLLDLGSWLYLPRGIVMKDRSAAAGEAGFSGTADFSGMLARIGERYYDRILIRDLHSPQFIYDYWLWEESSGIRAALLANYVEIRRIPAVADTEFDQPWFREISVLAPRPEGGN